MKEIVSETGRVYFICKFCGFKYDERKWAEKCEAWCSEHQSCSLEIIEHSVVED